jgi:hypothetical protein
MLFTVFGHKDPQKLLDGPTNRESLRLDSLSVTDGDFIAHHG